MSSIEMDPMDGITNVRNFGATGNGFVDDTAAIQAALDSMVKPFGTYDWSPGGGVLYFPPGGYRVSKPLRVRAGGLTIVGSGTASSQFRPCWIQQTFARPLVAFPNDAERLGDIEIRDITLVNAEADPTSVALQIWTGRRDPASPSRTFRRNFRLHNVGMVKFGQAIEVCRLQNTLSNTKMFTATVPPVGAFLINGSWEVDTGKLSSMESAAVDSYHTQIGNLQVTNCRFQDCGQILHTEPLCSINHCVFRDNEMGNNGKGLPEGTPVIDARVFNARIDDNILEGNHNAICLDQSDNISIQGNYFEGEHGDYHVRLVRCRNIAECNSRTNYVNAGLRGRLDVEMVDCDP